TELLYLHNAGRYPKATPSSSDGRCGHAVYNSTKNKINRQFLGEIVQDDRYNQQHAKKPTPGRDGPGPR
ncbi:MAG: hypothetical protein KAI94_11700, partial [Anaerolineales bacterium]|nr:hypothetical protein [Anaerolineales bacterium]